MRTWEDARREIVERIDVLGIYARYGVRGLSGTPNNGWVSGLCPLHEDKRKSFAVCVEGDARGSFKCFAECERSGGSGSIFDWVMLHEGVTFRQAMELLAKDVGVELPESRPPIPDEIVAKYHAALLASPTRMRFLADQRGVTRDTVEKWRIGLEPGTGRFTIPVLDEEGRVRNIRRYKPGATERQAKFLNYTRDGHKYGSPARLFGAHLLADLPDGAEVVYCEGEMDCMLLWQHGFPAVTSTGGAMKFNSGWARKLSRFRVVVVMDNDETGARAARRVAKGLKAGGVRDVLVGTLPDGMPRKGDVTDFFVALGGTAAEFRDGVLRTAVPFGEEERGEEEEPVEVSLVKSSLAELAGRPLLVHVLLSGKDMTPYQVPRVVRASCGMNQGERKCGVCGMSVIGGSAEVRFGARDPETAAFPQSSDTQIKGVLRKAVEAVQCPELKFEVQEVQNLEDLTVIPEVDYFHEDSLEGEYAVRRALYVGQNLQTNRSYRMRGYVHPDPRTQHAVLVVDRADPAQDNIGSFATRLREDETFREEFVRQVGVFRCDGRSADEVEARFMEVAEDFERNVHGIYQRRDMQAGMDLVWHSVIGFRFAGRPVRKGWVEALVIGDSGQGKTEMSMGLLRHYGLGERVQGEQVSVAGLIGGLQQTANRWMLTWGKMPLNDRRLIVLEEVSGMSEESLARLSDVRSTGIAEVTKIQQERTQARVRLLFLSNPRNGRSIKTYNHGVEAVLHLFGTAEDVRRLDFAVAVASGEVSPEVMTRAVRSGQATEPRYSPRACKLLVLWAWSRQPADVEFTPEAVDAVLRSAQEMGYEYSAKIPLVEPADQRVKIARLAAAAAARTFSHAEDDPLRLVVDVGHVEFVVRFLRHHYERSAMRYGDYSRIHDAGDKVTDEEREALVAQFERLPDWRELQRNLRLLGRFRKGQLTDMMGWDRETARDAFRKMVALGFLTPTPNGYVKRPFFTQLLADRIGPDAEGGVRLASGRNGSGEVSEETDDVPF